VEIDVGALVRNFRRFRARFPPNVQVFVSIKKDAYGHGAVEVVRALTGEAGLAGFGVAMAAEAEALRRVGLRPPLLHLSVLRGPELEAAVRAGDIVTVTDEPETREAQAWARRWGLAPRVHFKIDTGMGRLGRSPEEALAALERLRRAEPTLIQGLYTHLPDGWANPTQARRQLETLRTLAARTGLAGGMHHLGGSDALALAEGYPLPAVRCGIALYGAHPGMPEAEPVMTFKARIIYRRRAPAGTPISYGGTHRLGRETELAVVGAGYGNGYPWSLSNRGRVIVGGRAAPVLGRVCMDQMIVDATGALEAQVGDVATLFGRGPEGTPSVAEVAGQAGTIPYELMCLAGRLNGRVYGGL